MAACYALAFTGLLPRVGPVPPQPEGPCIETRHPDGQTVLWRSCDDDGDGHHETETHLDLMGRRTAMLHDGDRSGVPERGFSFAADGAITGSWLDADEDGRAETMELFMGDGRKSVFRDLDEDGEYEIATSVAADGTLIGTHHVPRLRPGVPAPPHRYVEHHPDGSTSEWSDADNDGRQETRTVRDAQGRVLFVEDDAWSEGMRRRPQVVP